MTLKSLWAVFAGVLVVIVVTTLVDIALHLVHVYPPMGEPLTDALSVLATAYRIVIGMAGGWVTARLAPDRPMRHALALGLVGTVLGIVGLVATWNLGLGPRWYPIALAVLAIPQSWAGGAIFESRAVKT
jgi:H+/Cl- antiporter ClcA